MDEIRDRNGLTEAQYLKSYNSDAWKKPSLTADICIIARKADMDSVLLIKRGNHPYLGKWALPGGFSEEGERIEETAARELLEETGIKMDSQDLKLVGVYSKPGRDPRGWTVSAAYLAVVNQDDVAPQAADDASEAMWFEIVRDREMIRLKADELELSLDDLAFDHNDIMMDVLKVAYDE